MAYEIKVFCGEDERKNIEDFTSYMIQQKNVIISGFGVSDFDVKMIQLRLMKYNAPIISLFGKWDIIELQTELGGYNKKGTLKEYLHYLGLEGKYGGYTGADVYDLYERGLWDEIEKYSHQDALAEHKLYELWNSYRKPDNKFGDVITIDTETVYNKDKIPDEAMAYYLFKKSIWDNKKITKESTRQSKLKEFNYDSFIKNWKQNAGLDKFDARIISISCCKSI